VWNELVAASGPAGVQMEFSCSGVVFFRVFGLISGVMSPVNVLSATDTTTFAEGAAEQGLLTEASEAGFGGPWAGPAPSLEIATRAIKFETPIEIKSSL
jgi:hypothetical protein